MRRLCFCALAVILAAVPVFAQDPDRAGLPPGAGSGRPLGEYILGPGDELVIMAVDADEIAKTPIRLGASGEFNLPMVGRIQASGLTVQQLETELIERLKKYIKQPQVSVSVTQYRSQPVTVLGPVRNPGIIQLEGGKTLIEVLSLAGGPLPDSSSKITITRRKESGPLPIGASANEPAGQGASHYTAEVDLREIYDGVAPEQNILILPHDQITLKKAPIVYAIGQLNKQGGFVLQEKETVSVLTLIAMAEGTNSVANTKDARIVRTAGGEVRKEIPVNIKNILEGKSKDVVLDPGDILIIPESYAKGTLRRTLDTAIQLTTGLAIYR